MTLVLKFVACKQVSCRVVKGTDVQSTLELRSLACKQVSCPEQAYKKPLC